MTSLLVSLLFLIACGNSDTIRNNRILIPDPEHQIKDSPDITSFDSILYTGWYYIADINNGYKRQLDKSHDYYFIDPKPIVIAKNFKRLEIYNNKEEVFEMLIQLDETGTKAWSIATDKYVGKKLAFILDNRLLEADYVNSQITAGVTALIRGDYTKAELENFKIIIESEK